MDEKTFLELAVRQIASLRETAQQEFPASTGLNYTLLTCENNLNGILLGAANETNDDEVEPVIPEGFNEDNFRDFLNTNSAAFDTTGEELASSVTDVAGLVDVNNDGNLVEVGNFDESADAIAEQIDLLEAENGELPEVSNLVTVSYTALNEEELTEENVREILDHPISQTLNKLGNIQLLSIEPGEQASTKNAVFVVLEEGRLPLKALALNAVAYRGIHVFPGIGAVQAVGSTNFIE